MSTARKLKRAADRRTEAARRMDSRPARRARPAIVAEERARDLAERQRHREWLASLSPEERERFEQRVERRRQRQIETVAPLLMAAMAEVRA